MNPSEWKPGTMIFHKDKDFWDSFLKSIGVHPTSLTIHEDIFYGIHKNRKESPSGTDFFWSQTHRFEQQDVFKALFMHEQLWSFYYKPIKKRNGDVACKVSSESRESGKTLTEVPLKDIYFVMEITDWDFKYWCLIKNEKEFIESKGGNRVLKAPNKKTRRLSNRIKYLYPSKKPAKGWLYHLYTCKTENVSHPMGHVLNSENSGYEPGILCPGMEIYAMPYDHMNLKPISFKSCWVEDNRIPMFSNYPQSLRHDLAETFTKGLVEKYQRESEFDKSP
tara:strand:- start:201 stop:1034 length:834 start_codon:yes stop_codon:yes gene_type:complete